MLVDTSCRGGGPSNGKKSVKLTKRVRGQFCTVCFTFLVAFLFLVVRPGAPSSVLAPSSDALCS